MKNEKEKANQFALPFNPFGSDKTTTDKRGKKIDAMKEHNYNKLLSCLSRLCLDIFIMDFFLFEKNHQLHDGPHASPNAICNTITIRNVINSYSDDLITWHRRSVLTEKTMLHASCAFFDLVGCLIIFHQFTVYLKLNWISFVHAMRVHHVRTANEKDARKKTIYFDVVNMRTTTVWYAHCTLSI